MSLLFYTLRLQVYQKQCLKKSHCCLGPARILSAQRCAPAYSDMNDQLQILETQNSAIFKDK